MKAKCFGFLLVMFAPASVFSNGGRTHAECGQRAMNTYLSAAGEMLPGLESFFSSDEIKRAFYCGCFLPDWGYSSGSPNASEDAHWHEFHEAYFNFLREAYPYPWDDEAKRHIAFFFGLVVHGISDIPWHFTDGDRKAVIKMAELDGGGHDSETAMDYFTHVDCTIDPPMPSEAFWWPHDDIVQVFQRRPDFQVTQEDVVRGCDLLRTAWRMGAGFGPGFYPKNAEALPWCKAHYQDYYYGGIDHGAAAAAMWVQSYYARLRGWHSYQQMPIYACKPPGYAPYLGVQDAHIIESMPDHNAGAEPFLEVSSDGQRRALIRFEISDTPQATEVSKATLWLHLAGRRGDQKGEIILAATQANRDWSGGAGMSDETSGTDGRVALDGEVTWVSARQGTDPWVLPGCAGTPEDREQSPASTAKVTASDGPNAWVPVDVTSLAGFWIQHPESNRGLLLKAFSAQDNETCVFQFISSDAWKASPDGYCGGKRVAFRPTLVIMTEMTADEH